MTFETFHGKTVLVTGHTGFKGSWLTLWLYNLGAKVHGYSLPPVTEPNNYTASRVADVLETEYLSNALSGEDLSGKYILDIDLDNFLCAKALMPEDPAFFLNLVEHSAGISISMERDWQKILRLKGESLNSDDILSMLGTLIGENFT